MRTRSRGKTQKEDSIVVDLNGGGVLLGRKTIRDMEGNKSILKENINGGGGLVTKNYLKYNHIQPPKIQNLNRPNNPIHPKMHSEVFNESFVDSLMYWKHPNHTQPGSGLKNLGNTCFLNSVLQCILYTVPLKNYFNDSDHSQMCKLKGVCFICEYGRLSKLVEAKKTAIIPQNIIQNIRNIAHHIKIGRQEDAHEFLIYFLAAMENSSIVYLQTLSQKYTQRNSVDTFFDENNLIQKIFGGILVSTVTCKSCKRESKKFDKFIDISLEISNSENILNCFEHFCKPENLTGNNKYFCDNCHKQNDSVKKLNFEKCKIIN
jgi:ubiquitin C-terminal hydrolase